jgi:hypothetical protein
VTWAAVPGLSVGDQTPQDERVPSARGGTDLSVPPYDIFILKMPLHYRYKDDRPISAMNFGDRILVGGDSGGLE